MKNQRVVVSLVAIGCLVAAVYGDGNACYAYNDHAEQYKLDHVAATYPWDEIHQAMSQNPMLDQILAQGTKVPTGRPPNSGHYYEPQSVVCPSQRFMLKAFQLDGKQCYVIKPEVQQVRYAKCNSEFNRDCHYCKLTQPGISKCEEDYEWQFVWAYCKPIPQPYYKPIDVHPQPYPVIHPQPQPYPQPKPNPYPQPKVHQPQPYPQPKPNPYPPQSPPYYPPQPQPQPEPRPYQHPVKPQTYPPQPGYPDHQEPLYSTDKLYAARPNNYQPRWKRSVPDLGKVEKLSIYLPYQCSCKNFRC